MSHSPPSSYLSPPTTPQKSRRSPSPTRRLSLANPYVHSPSSSTNTSPRTPSFPHRSDQEEGDSLRFMDPKEDLRGGEDVEMMPLGEGKGGVMEGEKPKGSWAGFLFWTGVNTFATIGIVFTNKAIFTDPDLKRLQTIFACFHFICTTLTLTLLSSPSVGIKMFSPRSLPTIEVLPLAVAMCLNVLLPNASLAHSSITFYQIARILLTPLVALINFIFFSISIPRRAAICLIPVIFGVWAVTYYDSLSNDPAKANKKETPLGAIFAFSGVIASSIYTVLIGSYHRRTQLSSMQLLYNQAPLSAFLLLFAAPFTDTLPYSFSSISINHYLLVLFSGFLAALINLSQFFIVAGAGAVSSTVVGHAKTVSIVALGWVSMGKEFDYRAGWGCVAAIGGIIGYSAVMLAVGKKA